MKIFSISFCIAAILAFASTSLLAQDIVIKGEIRDKGGRPVPGTNVLVGGTSSGTVVGTDGNFELKLSEGKHTLIISMIGYNTIDQKVVVEKGHEYRLKVVMAKETSMRKSEVVFEEVKE